VLVIFFHSQKESLHNLK